MAGLTECIAPAYAESIRSEADRLGGTVSPSDFLDGVVLGVQPVIVRLGPVSVRWFGVMVAAGLACGLLYTLRAARARGFEADDVYACALWAFLAGIVGARVFHVVDKLDFYLQNPYSILSPSQVSMSAWGGALCGGVALVICARRRGLPAMLLLDAAIPGFVLGQMIGRLGSLVNGESWGAPTSLPWGIIYLSADSMVPPNRLGIATHPYAAYELLWGGLILVVARWLARRPVPPGVLACTVALLYSLGRGFLGVWREEGAVLLGLQQAQVIALAVVLVALPLLVWLLVRRPVVIGAPVRPKAPAPPMV